MDNNPDKDKLFDFSGSIGEIESKTSGSDKIVRFADYRQKHLKKVRNRLAKLAELDSKYNFSKISSLKSHTSKVYLVGSAGENEVVSADWNFQIKRWDLKSGETKKVLFNSKWCSSVTFSPCGKYALNPDFNYFHINIWGLLGEKPKILNIFKSDTANNYYHFSRDGQYISANDNNLVKIINPANGKLINELNTSMQSFDNFMLFGDTMCSVSRNQEGEVVGIDKWDWRGNRIIDQINFDSNFDNTKQIFFSRDNTLAAHHKKDNVIDFWNLNSKQLLASYCVPEGKKPFNFKFSDDGKMLAIAYDNYYITIIDTESGRTIKSYLGYENMFWLKDRMIALKDYQDRVDIYKY